MRSLGQTAVTKKVLFNFWHFVNLRFICSIKSFKATYTLYLSILIFMAFWKTQFKLSDSLKIGGKLKCCGVEEIFDVAHGCRKTYDKYNHLPSPLGLSSVSLLYRENLENAEEWCDKEHWRTGCSTKHISVERSSLTILIIGAIHSSNYFFDGVFFNPGPLVHLFWNFREGHLLNVCNWGCRVVRGVEGEGHN